MKPFKFTSKLGFIGIIFLLTIILACTQSPSEETFWIVDPQGMFHTNDIQRAQQEIPFTIIVSRYLPDNLNPYSPHIINAPIKGSSENEAIELGISYKAKDKPSIVISEGSKFFIMLPTPELDPIYLDVEGVRVLQQKTFIYSEPVIEGFEFGWNQDGRTFTVQIFSYTREEAIKIVESMIKQAQ